MQYRHEVKHEISYSDMLQIKARLDAVARPDPHAKDGTYLIRSLYFDTLNDKALREKINGISQREKFRIRFYDNDLSVIRLEKKCKVRDLGYKLSCPLSEQEVRRLLEGDISWMATNERPLAADLYRSMIIEGLRPKSIVEYRRRPYIFDAGNVRVTFDYQIRTSSSPEDFLIPDCPLIPAEDSPILLEVKWDDFLPSIIQSCIQQKNRRACGFSKYAASRTLD